MKRITTDQEKKLDEQYRRHAGLFHRIVIRLFRRHINMVAKTALGRAFERSQIDTFAFHNLCGIVDRMLWPKWDDEPVSFVVQKNNVCGGDMAGRDINK